MIDKETLKSCCYLFVLFSVFTTFSSLLLIQYCHKLVTIFLVLDLSDNEMPQIKIPDSNGVTISLFEIDGRYYPRFPEDALRGVKHLKTRPDDVIVCAYPKSGQLH